jgi:hypothetical protein
MKTTQRLLREPLLHFLVIGGLIFGLYTLVSDPVPAPVNTIVIGPERIEQLAQNFEAVWRRPPSADELNSIIDEAVREEVYYREALALGLDTNDTMVRRRLRQKMEFLSDSSAALVEPAAGELEAYLLTKQAKFRRSPQLAFEQIFLGQYPGPERIAELLKLLQGDSVADPFNLASSSLLPTQLGLASPEQVDGIFGQGFFTQLFELPRGVWAGPVESAYGVHLARIGERVAASLPPLAEIRDTVLRDWKTVKAQEIRELHYAKLRANYVVEIIRSPAEEPAGQ